MSTKTTGTTGTAGAMGIEATDATGVGASLAGAVGRLPRVSTWKMIAISVFWFAINFHWGAITTLLIPGQTAALLLREAPGATLAAQVAWANDHKGLSLAIVTAPGLIVALIANPFFGLLSDRTRGRFGRRRPYILFGTLLNLVGLALMAIGPLLFVQGHSGNALAPSLICLMLGLMLTQLANNAAAAPFHALLPDITPPEQRGTASGVMGLCFMFGTISGALVGIVFNFDFTRLFNGTQSFGDYWFNIELGYGAVAAVMLVMALFTVFTVRERSWQPDPLSAEQRAASIRFWRNLALTVTATVAVAAIGLFTLQTGLIGFRLDTNTLSVLQLVAVLVAGIGAAWAFEFRPRRNPDFSWVVLTRMLVMMGIYIVQLFLFYYMHDVAHAPNATAATSLFLIILTLTATLSTFFAGFGSDRIGRKRMVYVSGAFMAVVGAMFVAAPYLVPGNILTLAYVAAAIFGLGFGAYIAVDWALVADTLPSNATFARDMGIWNIAQTLPQVFALVLGGWLLALGIAVGNPGLGYTFLFVSFVVFCVAGTVTVRYIRGVAR
ncbi:MAG: MFS transporter [Ktedonobacterales bacterium]